MRIRLPKSGVSVAERTDPPPLEEEATLVPVAGHRWFHLAGHWRLGRWRSHAGQCEHTKSGPGRSQHSSSHANLNSNGIGNAFDHGDCPRPLDETTAAQFRAAQWEVRFTYGGKVQWIMDRSTTRHPDGTFTFKLSATVTNQYGTDQPATIEGDVGGTDAAPTITDSMLYTNDGQTVNFNG